VLLAALLAAGPAALACSLAAEVLEKTSMGLGP